MVNYRLECSSQMISFNILYTWHTGSCQLNNIYTWFFHHVTGFANPRLLVRDIDLCYHTCPNTSGKSRPEYQAIYNGYDVLWFYAQICETMKNNLVSELYGGKIKSYRIIVLLSVRELPLGKNRGIIGSCIY